jgi:hypothetical protein
MTTCSEKWFHDVYNSLLDLGGKAHLSRIYKTVKQRRRDAGRSQPPTSESIVRTTLEDRCSGAYFKTGQDLFYMPEGKGAGVWAIRPDAMPIEIEL